MLHDQRRQFIGQLLAAPFVAGGLFASARAAVQDYANLNDYKALVCVYLDGGCDSHSLFLPSESGRFDAYTRARGALAVPANEVRYVGSADHRLGFNPALPDLADLYADKRIAVVQNLGNLVAPVTREDYFNARAWVPEGLFSHKTQQTLWQTASSGVAPPRLKSGWGGRMVDLLRESNRHAALPLSFSMAAAGHWLAGSNSAPLVLNQKGLGLLDHLDTFAGGNANRAREATLDKILQLPRSHALKQRAAESIQTARTASRSLHEMLGEEDYVTTSFVAGSSLANALKTVARMIIENAEFKMQRQVFFVRQPGWDTHVNQARRIQPLMQDLNASLAGFQQVLEEHSLQDSVTTFTASEFARSLSINTSGTDHGWGGQYLVMGGTVNGGRLLGEAPSYRLNGKDDAGGKGRFIPSVSTSQLGAALGQWFGLHAADLGEVFPELQYFANRPPLRLFR